MGRVRVADKRQFSFLAIFTRIPRQSRMSPPCGSPKCVSLVEPRQSPLKLRRCAANAHTTHGTRRGDEEEEDYDFEYSDEGEEDTDVDLENSYYSAKALKAEDPKAAVEAFREARKTFKCECKSVLGRFTAVHNCRCTRTCV